MYEQKKHTLQHAIFFLLIFLCACAPARALDALEPAPLLSFKVIRIFPHDATHYTQGLLLYRGKLLESAGRYGESALYEIDLKTGRTLKMRKLDDRFFAEGIAIAHERIVQLSWREQTGFIYDLQFKPIGLLRYDGEGWGLASTEEGHALVMSDGSSTLRFLDADDFHLLRSIKVHEGSREIYRLNELEIAHGLIFANIWLTDQIAVIDPTDGEVRAWLDLSALKFMFVRPDGWNEVEHVLNGIAYDSKSGHFLVTGKCWPALFEISLDKLLRLPDRDPPIKH